MTIEVTTSTTASPERVWAVLTDVARWPEWTTSVWSAQRLDGGPLRVGSRTRIKQPGMPTLIWEVTELSAPSRFTWVARSPGLRTAASHRLVPDSGGTRIDLAVEQRGSLAWLLVPLSKGRTRRYASLEAAGLKTASESAAPSQP